MLSLLRVVALATILATSTLAVPTSDAAAPSVTSASGDVVLTPHGYKSSANVHAVPAGSVIKHVDDSTIHVLTAAGDVHKVITFDPATKTGNATRAAPAARAMKTGWVADASWMNTGAPPIGSFKTKWRVPPPPATDHKQTVFLFNSIEPATFDAILQPVVQWGHSAAGGYPSSWSVASWYLHDPITFFTPLAKVNEGDQLDGEMRLIEKDATTGLFKYNCAFTNIPASNATIHGAEELKWATLTLEAYGVTEASDYPVRTTVFYDTSLELTTGEFPAVKWKANADTVDGLAMTVDVDGSKGAQLTIKYPQ